MIILISPLSNNRLLNLILPWATEQIAHGVIEELIATE
jgi:hypothetical protein